MITSPPDKIDGEWLVVLSLAAGVVLNALAVFGIWMLWS